MTPAAFLLPRCNIIALSTRSTGHLYEACGSTYIGPVVIIFSIATFHTTFAIKNRNTLVRRNLIGTGIIPGTAVVKERSKNTLILNKGPLRFKASHGMTGATNRIHIKLTKQRACGIFVLLIKPIHGSNSLGTIARRTTQCKNHKAVRRKTTDYSLVCSRSGSASRPPNYYGMFLIWITCHMRGVRKNSLSIGTGAGFVFNRHEIFFFFSIVCEEYFRDCRLFARTGLYTRSIARAAFQYGRFAGAGFTKTRITRIARFFRCAIISNLSLTSFNLSPFT